MFCPGCGLQTSDDLKFCRQCGASLLGVREAMASRSTGEKFDWSKTWWAELVYPPEELERRRGVTPEEKRIKEEKKRINEIKAGVITSLSGLGVMIFLYFFFDVVAEKKTGTDAEILRRLWLTGVIPLLVGIGLMINGFFISRRLVKLKEQETQAAAPASSAQAALPAKTTDQLVADATAQSGHSVTENTTAHLPERVAAPQRRDVG